MPQCRHLPGSCVASGCHPPLDVAAVTRRWTCIQKWGHEVPQPLLEPTTRWKPYDYSVQHPPRTTAAPGCPSSPRAQCRAACGCSAGRPAGQQGASRWVSHEPHHAHGWLASLSLCTGVASHHLPWVHTRGSANVCRLACAAVSEHGQLMPQASSSPHPPHLFPRVHKRVQAHMRHWARPVRCNIPNQVCIARAVGMGNGGSSD